MGDDNYIKTGLRRSMLVRPVDQYDNAKSFFVWDTGFMGVIPSDQYTRPLDFTFSRAVASSLSLAETPTVNSYILTLSTGHGLTGGESISVYNPTAEKFWAGTIISMVGDVATIDTPVNYSYDPASSVMFVRDSNMNIDGSSTTQVFSISNPFSISADITRINFHIRDATDMDDAKFGGMTALTRGIVMRKKISASEYHVYWNVKTNGSFGLLGTKCYQEKAPAGEYGLQFRITYAGMERHGVSIRLDPGQSLEILVQDNLQGLTFFHAVAQGHLTR